MTLNKRRFQHRVSKKASRGTNTHTLGNPASDFTTEGGFLRHKGLNFTRIYIHISLIKVTQSSSAVFGSVKEDRPRAPYRILSTQRAPSRELPRHIEQFHSRVQEQQHWSKYHHFGRDVPKKQERLSGWLGGIEDMKLLDCVADCILS